MADKVDALVKHLDEQHARMRAHILANRAQAEQALEEEYEAELPPSAGGDLATGVGHVVSDVVGGAGHVIGGVASTGADAIAVVGDVAAATHGAIDGFFSGVRRRLGI